MSLTTYGLEILRDFSKSLYVVHFITVPHWSRTKLQSPHLTRARNGEPRNGGESK